MCQDHHQQAYPEAGAAVSWTNPARGQGHPVLQGTGAEELRTMFQAVFQYPSSSLSPRMKTLLLSVGIVKT